ncbi:MAG: alpha-L-rhamnosidase-related protein [Armatimonadota bacterium]
MITLKLAAKAKAKKLTINYAPFTNSILRACQQWPAQWIGHPEAKGDGPVVVAYRRLFSCDTDSEVRIHVSADERYELFLDGKRIGCGPERGDIENWFYDTYDLELCSGQHVIVARTWWLGPNGPSPHAQMTIQPSFLLAAEGFDSSILNTGVARWDCKIVDGYEWVDPGVAWGTGAKVHIHGSSYPWGVELGYGDDWESVEATGPALNAASANEHSDTWLLRPSMLPAMLEEPVNVGEARHIQSVSCESTTSLPVCQLEHIASEVGDWNRLLGGAAGLVVPAHTVRRVIVDLGDYYTAYPEITVSGGCGAKVRILWAEALVKHPDVPEDQAAIKGNRNEILDKYFVGVGDTFESDGGMRRHFTTLWWEAGRYLEITVSTDKEPLAIDSLRLRATHYPFNIEGQFEASDHHLEEIASICMRTLKMCSHETFLDCPYYEQLMYIGDSRLEALITYATTGDDRLPRKALMMFDHSRKHSGITKSRYPSRVTQFIPPFSLWWVAMVHDFVMWRGDMEFVADLMPGVRSVMDAFRQWVNGDELLEAPTGWNFVDWVHGWRFGVPPDGELGINGSINWQLVLALELAADLEDFVDEPELASRNRKRANRIAESATGMFFDTNRGVFSEDCNHEHFSEHVQCLALLSGNVNESIRNRVVNGLLHERDLARTTVYFSHYLFETYAKVGRVDKLFERLEPWYDLQANGFKTTFETTELSRSDCHAWGAHPMYHYFASILGIRPGSLGFSSVSITPQLGPLTWAKGSLAHPKGSVDVDLRLTDDALTGIVDLPEGVEGTFVFNGLVLPLHSGTQEILVPRT